jgi:hypothetical protein
LTNVGFTAIAAGLSASTTYREIRIALRARVRSFGSGLA